MLEAVLDLRLSGVDEDFQEEPHEAEDESDESYTFPLFFLLDDKLEVILVVLGALGLRRLLLLVAFFFLLFFG